VYADNSATPNTISSPLFWNVEERDGVVRGQSLSYGGTTYVNTPNFAIIWDAANDDNNKGVLPVAGNYDTLGITVPSESGGTGYVKESSFRFASRWGHYRDPNTYNNNPGHSPAYDPAAGAIAKITVESMKYFPSDYQAVNNDPGDLGKKPNG
jgi:hypothetical protein